MLSIEIPRATAPRALSTQSPLTPSADNQDPRPAPGGGLRADVADFVPGQPALPLSAACAAAQGPHTPTSTVTLWQSGAPLPPSPQAVVQAKSRSASPSDPSRQALRDTGFALRAAAAGFERSTPSPAPARSRVASLTEAAEPLSCANLPLPAKAPAVQPAEMDHVLRAEWRQLAADLENERKWFQWSVARARQGTEGSSCAASTAATLSRVGTPQQSEHLDFSYLWISGHAKSADWLDCADVLDGAQAAVAGPSL